MTIASTPSSHGLVFGAQIGLWIVRLDEDGLLDLALGLDSQH
jgi:hypothetical protein